MCSNGEFVPLQSNEYVISDVHLFCDEETNHDTNLVASRFIFEVPSTLKTNFLSGEELHGNLNDSEQDDDYVILRENPVRDVLVIEHKRSTVLGDVGSQVWRGALYLSDFILDRPHLFRDRIVLELGVGVGLTTLVLQYAGCQCVFGTDYSAHILEQCRSNVDRNRASVDFSAAESGKGPSGTDVRIRTLDWYSGGILPGWKKVEPPEATASGNKTFEWDADDLLLLREDCLIVAADVIYSDSLTDAFFDTLFRLWQLLELSRLTVYIALEKRINFSMEEMAVCSPPYQHFCRCLNSFSAEQTSSSGPRLNCAIVSTGADTSVKTSVKQYFQYERVPELELWELTMSAK